MALFGRNEVHVGKAQKWQAVFNRSLHPLTLVVIDRIPFVHGQHHGAATFKGVARYVRVLIGHALLGVQQQQDHVGRFNRLQGFDHRELFNGLENLAFTAQTGRVNQLEFLTLPLKRNADRIPRGARHVKCHQALLS